MTEVAASPDAAVLARPEASVAPAARLLPLFVNEQRPLVVGLRLGGKRRVSALANSGSLPPTALSHNLARLRDAPNFTASREAHANHDQTRDLVAARVIALLCDMFGDVSKDRTP